MKLLIFILLFGMMFCGTAIAQQSDFSIETCPVTDENALILWVFAIITFFFLCIGFFMRIGFIGLFGALMLLMLSLYLSPY